MVDVIVPTFVNNNALFDFVPCLQKFRQRVEKTDSKHSTESAGCERFRLRACVYFNSDASTMFTQLVRAMNAHTSWDSESNWQFETEYVVSANTNGSLTTCVSALKDNATDGVLESRCVTRSPVFRPQQVALDARGVRVVLHGDSVRPAAENNGCVLPNKVHLQYRRRLHLRGWCFSILRRWAGRTLTRAQHIMASQQPPETMVVIDKINTVQHLRRNTDEYVALSLLLKVSSLLMHQTQIQSLGPLRESTAECPNNSDPV